ncbi:hypothetical protein PHISCL_05841 [Aspergillus sclerotialis]|uniref:Zn(2)-C6 fungal-type domain-containing protein n=1 Tax=Aspergillus sclerotialis TaxID=2070753 RepID=A0A3A2ZF86_9EURO|nr:hypothetical protein PHISCL_05841 [Aspergillus sclerotialis]
MSTKISRKRLACVECTRRKVKCDKILPCRNCTRKGTQCVRPRERERRSPNPSMPRPDERIDRTILPRPSSEPPRVIDELQSKIKQLENALREAKEPAIFPGMSRPEGHCYGTYAPSAETTLAQQSPLSALNSINTKPNSTSTEVEDAATILEFLAWGRRKDPTYQDEIAKRNNVAHSAGDLAVEDRWDNAHTPGPSAATVCQVLMPAKAKVYELVNYHCECLLWYHGAFHAGAFLRELDEFYDKGEGPRDGSGTDLQWRSLLFAVLTGSMASAPGSTSRSWGFRDHEKNALSHRWLKASIECLHQADYMARHSIYSVEAIATLTISAHMLGHSNRFSVLLASAVRIAQGLGLHQLNSENDARPRDMLSQEIGRRVWCQLCIQDWFSIPFTESYMIHRLCFNTEKPQNCDNDLNPPLQNHPTVTSYSRVFYDIAALMPALQDDCNSCNTLYTRYEEVLKYDRCLQNIASQNLPYYLENVPLDPAWPCYVPWARRSLAISFAHKVIMIHRKFLSLSFVNPMFEFTRKTCVAASKTIIKEQKETTCDGGPLLWIHQAFSVTASVSDSSLKQEQQRRDLCEKIILCLDMFHRLPTDPQVSEHRRLVEDGVEILLHCEMDVIARRGVSLLTAMLDAERTRSQRRNLMIGVCDPQMHLFGTFASSGNDLDIAAIIQAFYRHDRTSLPDQTNQTPSVMRNLWHNQRDQWSSVTSNISPTLEPIVPPGLDYTEGLDDILNLATNYLN